MSCYSKIMWQTLAKGLSRLIAEFHFVLKIMLINAALLVKGQIMILLRTHTAAGFCSGCLKMPAPQNSFSSFRWWWPSGCPGVPSTYPIIRWHLTFGQRSRGLWPAPDLLFKGTDQNLTCYFHDVGVEGIGWARGKRLCKERPQNGT